MYACDHLGLGLLFELGIASNMSNKIIRNLYPLWFEHFLVGHGKRRERREGHKGGCCFGMLLLNQCTWEKGCLLQGFFLWYRWGNMLQRTQPRGAHSEATSLNLVLMHPRHVGGYVSLMGPTIFYFLTKIQRFHFSHWWQRVADFNSFTLYLTQPFTLTSIHLFFSCFSHKKTPCRADRNVPNLYKLI